MRVAHSVPCAQLGPDEAVDGSTVIGGRDIDRKTLFTLHIRTRKDLYSLLVSKTGGDFGAGVA